MINYHDIEWHTERFRSKRKLKKKTALVKKTCAYC